MRRRLLACLLSSALALAALPAAAEDMSRAQVRSMLVTALQLEMLARACDFGMTGGQRVAVARVRDASAQALQLSSSQVAALRQELEAALNQDRARVCVEDEAVYRQTLNALTAE